MILFKFTADVDFDNYINSDSAEEEDDVPTVLVAGRPHPLDQLDDNLIAQMSVSAHDSKFELQADATSESGKACFCFSRNEREGACAVVLALSFSRGKAFPMGVVLRGCSDLVFGKASEYFRPTPLSIFSQRLRPALRCKVNKLRWSFWGGWCPPFGKPRLFRGTQASPQADRPWVFTCSR